MKVDRAIDLDVDQVYLQSGEDEDGDAEVAVVVFDRSGVFLQLQA